MNWIRENIRLFLIASLTLGLVPFPPEPHVLEKIKWVMGGGSVMQAIDIFDLLL